MTDPSDVVEVFRELAVENEKKSGDPESSGDPEEYRGAANAYFDAANYVEEELVEGDDE